MPFLEALIPTTDLIAWYALEDVTAARLASLADSSGNSRTLAATAADPDRPLGVLNAVNGYPVVRFDDVSPLVYKTTPPTVKAATRLAAGMIGAIAFGSA